MFTPSRPIWSRQPERTRHQQWVEDELIGLDREDPETQAFEQHLHRLHRISPGYTVEGYMAGIGDFADSARRAAGPRRVLAVLIAALLLFGVAAVLLSTLQVVLAAVL